MVFSDKCIVKHPSWAVVPRRCYARKLPSTLELINWDTSPVSPSAHIQMLRCQREAVHKAWDSHGLDRPWKVEYGMCCRCKATDRKFPAQPVSMSCTEQLSLAFTSQVGNALWARVSSSRAWAEAEVSHNLSTLIKVKIAATCLESLTDTLSLHTYVPPTDALHFYMRNLIQCDSFISKIFI